jgi:predicted Zn-ribbon and HTH transcriptional regulator
VKNFPWAPGAACPKCKSARFGPVTLIAGAVDYSLADRSKGYAIEDIRFAKMALWGGLITATQYNHALSRQKALADAKAEVPHIGRILVDMGAITEYQMEAVLEVRCKPRPGADDIDIGRLSVANQYCTEKQIRECEIQQNQAKKEGRDTPPMCFLLLERRYLKDNQLLAILKSEQKRRMGIIHEVQAAVEERKPLSTMEKYVGMKGDPKRKYRIVALVGVIGLLVLMWLGYYIWPLISPYIPGAGQKIGYRCEMCGESFMARDSSTVPIYCKLCGKKGAIYAYHCRKCGAIYGVQDRSKTTPKCPRCKSGLFEDLTPEFIRQSETKATKKGVE